MTAIKVSDAEEIDLPTIFTRDATTGLLDATKDYKTIDELRKMVNERPSVGFPVKAADAVTRAMRKLLEFYEDRLDRAWLWRGSEGDVTSAFLRYHLCRLFEYGKKFQGTQYTSVILRHIDDSLNEFSVDHGETSERRTYLDLVCRTLKSAVANLEQQKKERTLADLVGEAMPQCDDLAVRLLHNLTTYVTPSKYRKYIDRSLDPALLAEGFIKKEILHGKPGTHPKAILLHASPLGQNIKQIAKNYNAAKNINPLANAGVHFELKTSRLTSEEKQLNLRVFTEQQRHVGIARWGQRIHNALTTTSRYKNAKTESGETVPLTAVDVNAIQARINLLNALSKLNNDAVLIIKLFLQLQRYAKEKGDAFVANPANAHFIFDVLLSFGSSVRKDAVICEQGLAKVEEDHALKTLAPEEAFLLHDTKQLIVAIREEIESSLKAIKNYRTESHYEVLVEEIKVHEHETLKLFADLARERRLDVSQKIALTPSAVVAVKMPPKEDRQPLAAKPRYSGPGSHAVVAIALSARPKSLEVKKAEITLEKLDHILIDIHMQILENGKQEWKKPYEKIHEGLTHLRRHYFKMHGASDSDRRLKAERTKYLLYELCEFILAYLRLPIGYRRAHVELFKREVDAKINDPQQHFMDEHFGRVGKYLSDHRQGVAGFFYFDSHTHQGFQAVSEACHGLGRPLG